MTAAPDITSSPTVNLRVWAIHSIRPTHDPYRLTGSRVIAPSPKLALEYLADSGFRESSGAVWSLIVNYEALPMRQAPGFDGSLGDWVRAVRAGVYTHPIVTLAPGALTPRAQLRKTADAAFREQKRQSKLLPRLGRVLRRLGRILRAPFLALADHYRQDPEFRTWFWRLLGIGVVASVVLVFWDAIYSTLTAVFGFWAMYKLLMIFSKDYGERP